MKVVLVTGGFDPIHSGHIQYFNEAKKLGDKLIVGLNSDHWLTRKKGAPFMNLENRAIIIQSLNMVDEVIMYNDEDDTSCHAIEQVLHHHEEVIFANGGDRIILNIPEYERFKDDERVKFVCNVGGDKTESSSWLLDKWKSPTTIRKWGYYKELYMGKGYKVKELVIKPFSCLSMQRHEHRSELWNLVSGSAEIHMGIGEEKMVYELNDSASVLIEKGEWHMGCNMTDKPAHIVEIWRGDSDKLTEKDIERIQSE